MNADYIILILLVLVVILLLVTDWLIKSVNNYFIAVQKAYEEMKKQLEIIKQIHELENNNYQLCSDQYKTIQETYSKFLDKQLDQRLNNREEPDERNKTR